MNDFEVLRAQIEADKAKLAAIPTAKKIAKLDKTRASISAHVGRGGSLNSYRGQCLVDRYNDLIEALRATPEGLEAWEAYCHKLGSDPRHDGYDLFA